MLSKITRLKRLSWLMYNSLKTLTTGMPCVFVRCIPDEERMQISVDYELGNGVNSRTFNMERPQQETLGKALLRLQQNILKVTAKRSKKKSAKDPVGEVAIQLLVKGETLSDDIPNNKAWVDGAELHIDGKVLTVGVNLPTVVALSLPSSIMAGFPIFPRIELEFADLNHSSFKWLRVDKKHVPDKSSKKAEASSNTGHSNEAQDAEVSCDLVYTPTTQDIGHKLNFICYPKNSDRVGKEMSCLSKVEVEAGPGICPFDSRHLFTPDEAGPGCFRVMSYNILADLYADSDFSRENLFSYCPPYALAIDYRKQLLLKEICGYKADIICLQEVDRRVFKGCLLPALDLLEYGGWLKLKGGEVAEGSATFYRRSKFKLLDQKDVILSTFLYEDDINKDISDMVCTKPALKEALDQRSTALQVTVLECEEHANHCLCVANTHLYFHPDACNIRLIQTVLSLRFIEKICRQLSEVGKTSAVIFCGDFNSSPETGAVELITTGKVRADHHSWKSGGEDRYIQLDLEHSLKLISSCGYPEYTNFTNSFFGALDYIFSDSTKLSVDRVIPMFDHLEVTMHVALPSIVHPSDHIAVICDLKWKDI